MKYGPVNKLMHFADNSGSPLRRFQGSVETIVLWTRDEQAITRVFADKIADKSNRITTEGLR